MARQLAAFSTVLLSASLSMVGCNDRPPNFQSEDSVTPMTVGPGEAPYCTTQVQYTPSVTVTGQAQYIRREIFSSPTQSGLGSADPNYSDTTKRASVHPVRYAEVQALNASGKVVQCAATASDGTFSFALPQDGHVYTVRVNSRSAPAPAFGATHVYASILDSPASNQFYSITGSVTATGSGANIGTLTAAANGDLLGGAFNIFDQILTANDFLVAQVGNCSSTFALCENYDPGVHKVSVYWQKGFNPNDYFGPGGSGLSFYLPGYSRLFILGGLNGDTDSSDTDHFDNSVIIHEYGHFLEDNWLRTNSPGGRHNGNQLLDPRLAWSEGWGDFFQAAVRNENHYIDTMGNIDGATQMLFYTDTETAVPGADYPTALGEANFREFAITRLLWDAIDDTPNETMFGATDNVQGKFNEIWTVLSRSQYGYRDPNYSFRNVGLFHESQMYLQKHPMGEDAAASDWNEIRVLNQHEAGESHYAQYVVPSTSGNCTATSNIVPSSSYAPGHSYYFSISPAAIPGDMGGMGTSDLFQNNRFFRLRVNSADAGAHTLQLVYQDDDGNPTVADLDLYVYQGLSRFGITGDMLAYNRWSPQGANPEQVIQNKAVTVNFAAGDYLVNVNVYTGNGPGSTADYNLVLDGVVLCPGSLVPQ